jgi:hypothetical protein
MIWRVLALSGTLALCHAAQAAATDDIQLRVGPEHCQGFDAADQSLVVYATNSNSTRAISAGFKYDTVPSKQHFILFDSAFSPITDRFPKSINRRLAPLETAAIGCSVTSRAAPTIRDRQTVPLDFAKDSAAYLETGGPEPAVQGAKSYLAFYLQGGVWECAAGSRAPGLVYAVNLHPFASLSGTLELTTDRGSKAGTQTLDLAPLSAVKVGCSNGSAKLGSVANLGLNLPAVAVVNSAAESLPTLEAAQSPALPLNAILSTQNICAGPVPPGWIKINDAWNPTVCGKPASTAHNVWTLQHLSDLPAGAIVYACFGTTPPGWVLVTQMWNPTLCGQPSVQQPNVMVIKRSN